MACFILRGSILQRMLTFCCLLILVGMQTPVALGQHAPGHSGGPVGGHGIVPPASRPPLMRPPIALPQVYVAPGFAAFGTGRLLLRMQSTQPTHHPVPPVFPVGVPLFFGWPLWPFGGLWGFPGYGLGWGFNYCYWMDCSLFWNWQFTVPTTPFYEYTPAPPIVPTYVYPEYGELRRDTPQIFLKDGTVYNVKDYWRIDDQLHFTIYEPGNPKPAEHVINIDQLDVQKTIDVNTARGFRFVIREEPMEQYERDHPNQVPPDWPRPDNQ
jgi:hypothetical protein